MLPHWNHSTCTGQIHPRLFRKWFTLSRKAICWRTYLSRTKKNLKVFKSFVPSMTVELITRCHKARQEPSLLLYIDWDCCSVSGITQCAQIVLEWDHLWITIHHNRSLAVKISPIDMIFEWDQIKTDSQNVSSMRSLQPIFQCPLEGHHQREIVMSQLNQRRLRVENSVN